MAYKDIHTSYDEAFAQLVNDAFPEAERSGFWGFFGIDNSDIAEKAFDSGEKYLHENNATGLGEYLETKLGDDLIAMQKPENKAEYDKLVKHVAKVKPSDEAELMGVYQRIASPNTYTAVILSQANVDVATIDTFLTKLDQEGAVKEKVSTLIDTLGKNTGNDINLAAINGQIEANAPLLKSMAESPDAFFQFARTDAFDHLTSIAMTNVAEHGNLEKQGILDAFQAMPLQDKATNFMIIGGASKDEVRHFETTLNTALENRPELASIINNAIMNTVAEASGPAGNQANIFDVIATSSNSFADYAGSKTAMALLTTPSVIDSIIDKSQEAGATLTLNDLQTITQESVKENATPEVLIATTLDQAGVSSQQRDALLATIHDHNALEDIVTVFDKINPHSSGIDVTDLDDQIGKNTKLIQSIANNPELSVTILQSDIAQTAIDNLASQIQSGQNLSDIGMVDVIAAVPLMEKVESLMEAGEATPAEITEFKTTLQTAIDRNPELSGVIDTVIANTITNADKLGDSEAEPIDTLKNGAKSFVDYANSKAVKTVLTDQSIIGDVVEKSLAEGNELDIYDLGRITAVETINEEAGRFYAINSNMPRMQMMMVQGGIYGALSMAEKVNDEASFQRYLSLMNNYTKFAKDPNLSGVKGALGNAMGFMSNDVAYSMGRYADHESMTSQQLTAASIAEYYIFDGTNSDYPVVGDYSKIAENKRAGLWNPDGSLKTEGQLNGTEPSQNGVVGELMNMVGVDPNAPDTQRVVDNLLGNANDAASQAARQRHVDDLAKMAANPEDPDKTSPTTTSTPQTFGVT